MPYIPVEDRKKYIGQLESVLCELIPQDEENLGGHLNFCIFYLMTRLFEDKRRYVRINTLMGAMEGAKQEFYRFHAANYEEEKRKLNGDV